MANISFDVTAQNLARIVEAINSRNPKPFDSKLTDAQWAKEWIRRVIIDQVQDYETKKAIENLTVSKDEGLLL